MKGQTLFNPVDYDFNRRAPDPDTLTLTLTSTSTPDLAGYPRIINNVGSSTIVPLAPSPRCCADAAPAAHSISPSGGGGGREARESVAPAQVLRHLTVASGSRHTTALPAVALSCARMGELLISRVKLGVRSVACANPDSHTSSPRIEAQARMGCLILSSS